MADLLTMAQRRLGELEQEMIELRQFIATAQRLSGDAGQVLPARPAARTAMRPQGPLGSSPAEIVSGLMDILQPGGAPISRDDLVEMLGAKGIIVPGLYASKNLGTILWRNKTVFEHVRGQGYRRANAPGAAKGG